MFQSERQCFKVIFLTYFTIYLYKTFILLVKAHDGDRGINNAIRYSIAHGGDAHFAIDEKTGLVYTTKALDREDSRNQENGAYILEIVATERSRLRVKCVLNQFL